MSFFNYNRRNTIDVYIGNSVMGGNHPILIQSMTNTSTLDTESSVAQCARIVDAGAHLVRLTAQGVREAENLRNIRAALRDKGYEAPLSADIHFNPRAADAAAKVVEKVRINPGNFVDKQKTFAEKSYSEEEYADELQKIRDKFIPLLAICKTHGTAIRIGVNHGSLSDRIMSRYGDTPEGMVASCMEYLRIAVEENFSNIVISMKTSNTLLMTKAVRLLVKRMDEENLHFPLHLGVTEAGDGEDGRIKSAVGIGALLSDGIGDTIRVSLSEAPEYEVPVAQKLANYVMAKIGHEKITANACESYDALSVERRATYTVRNIGGDYPPVVISDRSHGRTEIETHYLPDYVYVGNKIPDRMPQGMKLIVNFNEWKDKTDCFPLFRINEIDTIESCGAHLNFLEISYPQLSETVCTKIKLLKNTVLIVTTNHINGIGEQRAFFHRLLTADCRIPVVIHRQYSENKLEDFQLKSSVDLGTLLLDGFGNGIFLSNQGEIPPKTIDSTSFGILQAARVRTSKTEFISCPSCGRTLFDLQTTVAKVKAATSHLSHLKIGIMGCIVNGPGEMADADYGYVGAGKNRISLYRKKECVKKNIPSEQAVEELVLLIKEHGDWTEPKDK